MPSQKDEFLSSTENLISSLQQDNKNLRTELSDKEKELFSLTNELNRIIVKGGDVSDHFLIASLQSARESMSSLDTANKELLDALSSRQEEIMRLSSAGMALQARTQSDQQRIRELETENVNMGKAIDQLLEKEGK